MVPTSPDRTFKDVIVGGLKVGVGQTGRFSAWILGSTLLATVGQEVLQVGAHYELKPTYNQRVVYDTSNAMAGGLAGAACAFRKDPAVSLMSRTGRVLTRPQLRLAYTVMGAVGGLVLPKALGDFNRMLDVSTRRVEQRLQQQQQPPAE